MGSAASTFHVYDEVPDIEPFRTTFEALQLTEKDVGGLYKLFKRVTGLTTDYVDRDKLLDFLDVDRNPFTKRVFSVFDEDGSGSIDFREFVVSAWNYCTLGNATLGKD
jgi:Ca2+-binding EF-hand superfamily protein